MKSVNIHEIIIDKENMQVISADAAFYYFMGDDRQYMSFDKFVVEEDKELFLQKFGECAGERFMMRLKGEDGKCGYYFTRVKSGTSDGNVTVLLLYAESLVEMRNQLTRTLTIQNAILEMYHDIYFDYEPGTGMIRLYTMEKGEQSIESFPFEEFERRLIAYADEKQKKDVHEFIMNIKMGKRRFEMHANRNLFKEENEDCQMTIGAESLYEKGVFSVVAGCIHIGNDYGQNARRKTEVDSLTGLIIKADITNIAIDLINVRKVKGITLAIVDIDYFKNVNDTYGHMCGDEVLLKVAGIMEKEVGNTGLVGRIGGDEFLIIFYHADNMEHMRERLNCIKNNVKTAFPQNVENKPAITLSIGCAAYPKDADNYEAVFNLADFALYRAKEKGRDRYIIYDKDKHGDPEEIKDRKKVSNWIDSRGNMTMGDILCVMMDKVYSGEDYPLERLLDDFVINFGIQRIMIYAGKPYHMTCVAGGQRLSAGLVSETEHYINADGYQQQFDADGILFMDDVKFLEDKLPDVYELLGKQSICSLIQIKFTDKCGNSSILSLEAVKKKMKWNRSNLHYYRLFARILSEYEFVILESE